MQNFHRPGAEGERERIVDFAYGLAKQEDYGNAIALCEWLMEEAQTATAGRRERAAVLSHQGDIAAAIQDLEHVVADKPPEPADLHALGMLQLQSGATTAAIESFGQALAAGAALGSTYYNSSSLPFRAEAKLAAGRPCRRGRRCGAAARGLQQR